MKNIKYLLCAICAIVLSACSDDDEKYTSYPPLFESMTAVNDVDGGTTLRVGEQFTITANERKEGKLLYKTTYAWAAEPGNLTQNDYTAGYNSYAEGRNPSAKMVISQAGTYTITLTAKYWNAAANVTTTTGTEKLEDGTEVEYREASVVGAYTVVLTKTIKVLDREQ